MQVAWTVVFDGSALSYDISITAAHNGLGIFRDRFIHAITGRQRCPTPEFAPDTRWTGCIFFARTYGGIKSRTWSQAETIMDSRIGGIDSPGG